MRNKCIRSVALNHAGRDTPHIIYNICIYLYAIGNNYKNQTPRYYDKNVVYMKNVYKWDLRRGLAYQIGTYVGIGTVLENFHLVDIPVCKIIFDRYSRRDV